MYMPQYAALAQQYAAAPLQETVTLPADAYPGKEYSFTSSSGQTVTFAVPAGLYPGSQVSVEVPQQQAAQQYQAATYAPQYSAQQTTYAPQYSVQQATYTPQYSVQQAAYAPQYSTPQYYKAAAQQQEETVTLPADAYPGKQYSFAAPDGRSITFSVPAGSRPHDALTVSF